jgi:hypothetical protein
MEGMCIDQVDQIAQMLPFWATFCLKKVAQNDEIFGYFLNVYTFTRISSSVVDILRL